MNTLLGTSDLARISIGRTYPDGTRVHHTFSNNGRGELVEQPTPQNIIAPTEPDGDDSHPNEPRPLPAPVLEDDNVIVWNAAAAAFFARRN